MQTAQQMLQTTTRLQVAAIVDTSAPQVPAPVLHKRIVAPVFPIIMGAVFKFCKQTFIPLVVGIVLGTFGVLVATPNQDGQVLDVHIPRGHPHAKGVPPQFSILNRKLALDPKVLQKAIDNNDNDAVLLISKHSLSAHNARWIADLPLQVLSKWITLDPKSAVPWLFKHLGLLPDPKLHQILSLADAGNSDNLLKRIREHSSLIPEDYYYILNSANIRGALNGGGADLDLDSDQSRLFRSFAKNSEKLLYLSTLDHLQPSMKSQILQQLSIIDSQNYIEACNRTWSSLDTQDKSTQLNSLIPLYEKGEFGFTDLKDKFLDYYAVSDQPLDSTPRRVIASVIKGEGAASALDLLTRVTDKPRFNYDSLMGLVNPIILSDPGASSEWLNSSQNGMMKNAVIEVLVATLSSSPDLALPWINQSTDPASKERMIKFISGEK